MQPLPSISVGPACMYTTNHKSKILKKLSFEMCRHYSCHYSLKQCNNYLYSIYIILVIIYNSEMISNMWEDIPRLYMETMPFYYRNLSTCSFYICRGERVLQPNSQGYQGMTVLFPLPRKLFLHLSSGLFPSR